MPDARRAGVAALLVLVAGGLALTALSHLGIVRLAGVGRRWWYGALAAPLVGATVTALVMLRALAPMPAVAAWTGPALAAPAGVPPALGAWPALIAAPLAWGVARLAGRWTPEVATKRRG